MTNFTNKTFKETYRDFYKKGDGYHRVLFNSGKALQARELNELQSILHEEIARFGRNIFREGSMVQSGGTMLDNSKEYIRLEAGSNVPIDIVGQEYQNSEGIRFSVEEFHESTEQDPPTLIVKYLDTTGSTDNSTPARVVAGDTLTPVGATTFPLTVSSEEGISPAGTGTTISVNEGVFFVDGHFVHVEEQTVYISKYISNPTVDFGFKVVETIVTEGEDPSLYDNQGEFPNTSAPGAHRFKIELIPTTRDQIQETDNFVFVARIVEGVITRDIDTNDAYNTINDLLATRTKEESGDYVAKEFKTVIEEKDEDTLDLEVTAGTAYVDGYRLDFGATNLDLEKARETATLNNDSVTAQYGNYVIIDETTSTGLSELATFGQVSLGGASTANVRAIENVGGEYRLYLFNIQMESGASFRDVTTITGSSGSVTLKTSGLFGSIDNTLLFPLSNPKASSLTDTNYTSQRTIEATSDASGEIFIAETLNGSYVPVIFEVGVGVTTGAVIDANKITGLAPSTNYIVTYYFESPNPVVRPKAPTVVTETVTLGSGTAPVDGPFFTQGDTMWRVDNNTGSVSIVWDGELIATSASSVTTLNEGGYQYTRGSIQTPTFTTTYTAPTSTNISYADFIGNYTRSFDYTTSRTVDYGGVETNRTSSYTRTINQYNTFYKTQGFEGSGGGVYVTNDGGFNWTFVTSTFPADHPGPAGVQYWWGSSNGSTSGIYYPTLDELFSAAEPTVLSYTRSFTGMTSPTSTSTFTRISTGTSDYTRTRASSYVGYYTQNGSSNGSNYSYYEVSRQSLATSGNGSGSTIELNYADGMRLITVLDQDLNNVTSSFEFDGGQRDNYYGPIKLRLKSGLTAEEGSEYTVTFEHYFHGDGDYFSVESYSHNYSNIPTHKTSAGVNVSLTDVLDFRPVILPSGVNVGSINPLPKNKSIISVDATYYLPRIDVLVANTLDAKGRKGLGRLQVIQGESSLDPRVPEIPTGSLPLFQFDLNAYTSDKNDLSVVKIPHKRFTMKDIAKLEDRVDTLYELTTLSLLEADTASLMVLDENGNNRTKSGFIADNFSGLNFCDLDDPNYRASVETVTGELMPSFRENSVRLAMKDNQSTAVRQGDVAVLPYSHHTFSSQLLATGKINVNPFAVITQTGHMTLSPASDEWVEVRSLPDVMQSNVRRVSTDNTGNRRRGRVRTRIVERTIQDFLGEQVVDVEVVPFMRSREIFFRVEGLRPNTNMFAFFGNKPVQDWVRQEIEFKHFSDNPQEFGSEFANATNHPKGNTDLVTDDKGVLIGSFFLPNTSDLSFRTGQQEFKLLDISVNDDDAAIASSRSMYESIGRIESVQRTIRTTRIVETIAERYDPLAQTFFVDQTENPNGMYLSKVKVFMESKDDSIPLQIQIRPVENGIPTTRIVPGSVKFTSPDIINTVAMTDQTDIADVRLNAGTDIEFDEPVYLTAGEEYAIVLLAESVKYNAYVAETYEFVLGPNQREGRVNKQPTLGSLFLSQNGSTWTADQTRDLMFELYHAQFNTTAKVVLSNVDIPKITLGIDPISVESNSSLVHINHQGHGFNVNDEVTISGVQGVIGGISPDSINGTHIIASVSWNGYRISVGETANTSQLGGGSEVIVNEQIMIDELIPNIASIIPNGTRITATVAQTSGASYGANRNNPLYNSAYSAVAPKQVFLNDLNLNDKPTIVSSAGDMTFDITLSTTDNKVSPLIDLQRVSVMTLENVIDTVDAAQHITTPVVLDQSAVGLKVLFSAHRPSDAELELYIKTSTDESSLEVSDWIKVEIDTEVPSDQNREVFREYVYTIDTLDQFTIFQTKLVMKSTNSSKVPIITDFRAIALAV